MKILFSNLGYAKGISGSLWQHMSRFNRHLYSHPKVQQRALTQFKSLIETEKPDICCIVEIDRGSIHSAYFNQVKCLLDEEYCFHDVADKYGPSSRLGHMPLHSGKSNAFLAKTNFPFDHLYFSHGSKRLIYRIQVKENLTLFFAHFSLQRKVREKQFQEMRELAQATAGEKIILADFNIMHGFSELRPLLQDTDLKVLNRKDEHTFMFHRRMLVLDLCICSESMEKHASLRVLPQPFSDHAALLLEF